MTPFALICLFCALVPTLLFLANLKAYAAPPAVLPTTPQASISLLIPARDEEASIAAALESVLASTRITLEVIVMDDASTDQTVAIVQRIATCDPRVRLAHAPPLPAGWNGKQHACWALSQLASNPILCFMDADVRLAPDALARMAAFLDSSNAALVSGFPRQITGTFLERLLLPLIHFVLLGFLPIARMRKDPSPALAAGCGQFLMARRDAYLTTGGHSNIRETMHDGLRLPRLFRQHGLATDLADLTQHATCRMYTSASQVWQGLAKNATEGLAAPTRIVPFTLFLLLGQVLPFLFVATFVLILFFMVLFAGSLGIDIHFTHAGQSLIHIAIVALAALCAWLVRILAARRYNQSWLSAALHPIGILVLLILQWYALLRKLTGRSISWKTRAYPTT